VILEKAANFSQIVSQAKSFKIDNIKISYDSVKKKLKIEYKTNDCKTAFWIKLREVK